MGEIRIKQIEVFGKCFKIIKSSLRNSCNECELYNNCHDIGGGFISDFCSQHLTNFECFKEVKE